MAERAIFWFDSERMLLGQAQTGPRSILEFSGNSPELMAFRLFLRAEGRGLSLAEIHRARSPHEFREERHGSALRMFLSRLRQELKKIGIELTYERTVGRYRLRPRLPLYWIRARANKTPATIAQNTSREEALLKRIAMEGFVETSVLCTEFGLSRKTLHPTLRALVDAGRIQLVRRGPTSGYRLGQRAVARASRRRAVKRVG